MILTPEQLQDLGMAVFREAGVPEESSASVVEALVPGRTGWAPLTRVLPHSLLCGSGSVRQGKSAGHSAGASGCSCGRAGGCGKRFAFPAIWRAGKGHTSGARQRGVRIGSHPVAPLRRGWAVCGTDRGSGAHILIFSNTPAAMAPWNGSKASFGTNPLAFGCPREGKHPLVIDMSLSKVARGKIMGAKQRGEAIPEGWALDAAGRATTDPVAALGGTMIPVGDAKGAALALMVEILSATLTGANHAYEASSFFEPTGNAPGIGQTFILLDPKPLNPDFSARLEALCGHLLGQEGVRLPGERRFALRERNRISGVNLPEALYNDLRKRAGVA